MPKFKKNYHSFQQGLNRLQTAMTGKPDRVPVFVQMHEFAMRELGVNARDFFADPDLLVGGYLSVLEKFEIDIPTIDYDVYNIEAEAIGQTVIYSEHDMPDVDRSDPLIKNDKDLKKIKKPDFASDGRLATIVEANHRFCEWVGEPPTLNFCAPFSLAANIRGIEQLLMDILMKPDFASELFDRITEELLTPWILHLKETCPGASKICGNDATSSLPIVNTDILRDWILPYVLRLRELCGPEIYVPNWVGESHLKNPEEMLALKLQACPDFLEGQDPDVAGLGPSMYKDFAEQNSVPLILGVGAGFLALSTPQDISARVRKYIEAGGQNGRFCLYLCNIGATTPAENIKSAVAAVHKYGIYG